MDAFLQRGIAIREIDEAMPCAAHGIFVRDHNCKVADAFWEERHLRLHLLHWGYRASFIVDAL